MRMNAVEKLLLKGLLRAERRRRRQLAVLRRRCIAAADGIARLLARHFRARRVILFGSVCDGGHFHERSDLDIIVEGIPAGRFFMSCAEAATSVEKDAKEFIGALGRL